MDSPDRADFLKNLEAGGKYEGVTGIYRHNVSADHIGIFDKEIVDALAASGVKWIAHNGAGYDQIDVLRCKEKGAPVFHNSWHPNLHQGPQALLYQTPREPLTMQQRQRPSTS